jgi:hypothetical protein
MATWIDANCDYGYLEWTELSDYAWSAARFLFPRAARY